MIRVFRLHLVFHSIVAGHATGRCARDVRIQVYGMRGNRPLARRHAISDPAAGLRFRGP
jgi:hypothetical protein